MARSIAPFVPTHREIVTKMLELAHVRSDDIVFDLGCGDGRILFTAVNDFGAKRVVGYELRKDLHEKLLQEIENQHLDGRITVFNDDLLNANISEASVITLYLTTTGNKRLQPKILEEAKPGTRIVSHSFDFAGWSYTKKEKKFSFFPEVGWHILYLYTIPEAFTKKRKPRSFLSYLLGSKFKSAS